MGVLVKRTKLIDLVTDTPLTHDDDSTLIPVVLFRSREGPSVVDS